MRRAISVVVLAGWVLSGAEVMAQTERGSAPGDKRKGEQEQINAREEWFIKQRGLDTVVRPDLIRAGALEELKLSLSQTPTRVVPGSWVALGPSPMNMLSWSMGRVAGRVSALAVHPASELTLFLGTASGGLWRTSDGGTSWSSVFDAVGTQTIGSVIFDPNNAGTLWAGTGEQGQSCISYFGMGVFRSQDGGFSFQPRNGAGGTALNLSHVAALAVQPGNSNLVLAGGSGPCSGGFSGSGGLYRSTDAGGAWSKVLDGSVGDVLFDPLVPSTAFAVVGGGSASAGVYRSLDGGATWSQLGSGLPSGSSVVRGRLAMAPTNRLVLYALLASSNSQAQLYRTLDGGASWSLRNANACPNEGNGGQCLYNLALAVSPATSDTVIAGSIRPWRSTNGGTTLAVMTNTWGSGQQVHQDTHVVRYSATNASRIWIGSDGGLWRTDNGGASYTNQNGNLNITQFYDVAVHPTDSNRIYGGAQDNSSSWRTTSPIWSVISVGNNFPTGDGFVNAYDQGNANYIFIESYPTNNGFPRIYRSTNAGSTFSLLPTTGIPAAGATFPFVTQSALIYGGGTSHLLTGSTRVYRANARQGSWSWTEISNFFTDNMRATSFGTSLAAGNSLYVAFSETQFSWIPLVFRTDNILGTTVPWTDVTGNLPFGSVSDLAVDPTNRLKVFATRSTFDGNKLYRSTTGGTTWVAVGSGLPDVPANTVAIDAINRQRVFVGTDIGVYVSEDGGDTFGPQMSGLPLGTVITDLEVDNSPHILTAGTYGRGAWQLTLPSETGACVPDGGVDDALSNTSCCSGVAVQGSSVCLNGSDLSTCRQICGTPLVGGCVPSGGIDDIKSLTSCCSGASVPGSAFCLDPADYGTDWISCTQICQ